MKKLLILFVLLAGIPGLLDAGVLRTKYADMVNPMVGTDFHGHTFPGATYPFGMIQLSPDTREDNWDGCSGYHYSDSLIKGFSHTHLSGTGCADLCDIRIMPVVGYEGLVKEENYQSPFSHRNEHASAGYYSVHLDRWDVEAELTVGRRIGAHRYTYPKDATPQLVVDLGPRDRVLDSKIELAGENAIQGFRSSRSWADGQMCYFYMEFSRPITGITIAQSPHGATALLSFDRSAGQSRARELVVKAAISSVSEEGAKANLKSEDGWKQNGLFSFDLLRQSTRVAWNDFLSKIEVEGDAEAMKVFYTALYHAAIAPSLYSDSDGMYLGMDRRVHKAVGFDRYHIFSLWDTYRTLHPLFNIIERKRTVDFIKSMLSIYDEGGKLPVWELCGYETNCMIGYSSAPMIADALAKGIDGFDVKKALKALVATSNRAEFGIDVYRDNGLVLAEREHESVSKTLEYALDDWCISQVAHFAGDRQTEAQYQKRAQYWRNVYDPTTGFMRPRINGIWLSPFNPTDVNVHYTEANSWQYSFHVQHDVNGLIDVSGGDDSMIDWLDELFTSSSDTGGAWKVADMTGMVGQYAQGNEPSHHIAYLYAYAGAPWKAQRVLRGIMDDLFTSRPDGLCGNEDCGQMSAWYVMSALGFYPVTPGSDVLVFGTPLFRNAVIHLENGKDFTVRAPRTSQKNPYINHVMRDGVPYSKSYLRFSDIEQGHTFILGMDGKPNPRFGSKPDDRPVAAVPHTIVENPWFDVPSQTFSGSTTVALGAADKRYRIWYRVLSEKGGAQPDWIRYQRPFTISRTSTIEAYCTDETGATHSFITTTTLRKFDNTFKVKLANKYEPTYNAGGDNAIVDGVRGNTNFRLGGWQGYQGCDFDATIDLGKTRRITRIAAGFLQDSRAWILMPQWVEYYTSTDGKKFVKQGQMKHAVDPKDPKVQIFEFPLDLRADARYVRVVAKNFGVLPDWHQGAGGEAHLFVDEVTVL